MSLTDKILSPDTETFSTPPTTPGPFKAILAPSLSRRNSRPTSLHIDHKGSDWNPDIQLLPTQSPDPKANGNPLPPIVTQESTITPASPNNNHSMHQDYQKHANSPCFVHSQLDKGAHLTDWLKNKQSFIDSDVVGVAKSLQYLSSPGQSSTFSTQNSDSGNESDDEYAGNLTKRLAETAVGVREMSKQLGRARVQSNIHNVLIITKARDNRLIKLTRQLALYLMIKKKRGSKRGLVVYVDNQLRTSRRFDAEGIRREYPELFAPFPRRRTSSNQSLASYSSDFTHKEDTDEGQLRYWTSSMCSQSPHLFDFVVTLGGDGTVLFTSWLFQRVVPPVLPFALGSLGFLTNFDFANYQSVMDSAIDNGIRINLRMRFTCTVYRAVVNEKGKGRKAFKKGNTGEIMMENLEHGWEALEGGGDHTVGEGKRHAKDKEILCFTTRPVETFEVLNDLVVDRGPSPYVSQLELFGDEHHMTTVQADGLTVSTPTGSTAYSLSAGGSLVHPEIPAILITPICPHTLSFRPMLLPDSMELRICVPHNSRSTAWASFDGRGRVELKQGDHIKVTASKYPFPTVCADKQSTDWFHAISRTLKWNERERQKSFVMVEEEPLKEKKERRKQNVISGQAKFVNLEAPEENLDEEEDDCSEEEEDKFDIDDSSPEANINEAKDPGTETDDTVPQIRRPRASSAIKRKSKSRSRSRPPPMSGVNSPSRYGGPTPHPPHISPRHVGFDGPDSSRSSPESEPVTKSAKERLLELEAIKTPTPTSVPYIGRGRGNSRVRPADQPEHRAFAVWGHDESDSNASDNESVY